jgi:endonuclease G
MTAAKTIINIAILGVLAVPSAVGADLVYDEIHCKHFFYGYPTGTPASNDMIIRDIYALSSNDETKFADWVAYRLDEDTITGPSIDYNYWKTDPWLDEDETLEAKPLSVDDYRGAHAALETDRGHQAPLASFNGTTYWGDTNYYSNITPQTSDLNQGPWKKIEDRVRDLVGTGHVVYVMTGPLYEREMPPLSECDEHHRVPSGYWKVVAIQPEDGCDSVCVAALVFDQETPRNADVLDYLVTVDEIENRSGLDLLWEMPDDIEAGIESFDFREWAAGNFG